MEIGLEGLSVSCIVGCYEEERLQPQEIIVECSVILSDYLKRDDLSSTVNYEEIMNLIIEAATKGKFHLIELLAETICNGLFAHFPQVATAKITIRKPQALSGRAVPYVYVERDRNE